MRLIDADAIIIDLLDRGIEGVQADDYAEFQQIVEDAPTVDAVPKWIPVTERLPEEHIRVLVVNDDAKFMVAERADDDWWYQYYAYDVDRWDKSEQGVITHWMPLPEPPKEEV